LEENMSKKYIKIWENFYKKKLPKSMEIHHIDGNNKNNSVENLKAVTIEEHLNIHLSQNDYGAVQAILMRINMTDEQKNLISTCASKHQRKLWQEGKHNFQKIPKDVKKQINKDAGLKTLKEKVGIHDINFNPVLASENGKNARRFLSREKELEMMESWRQKNKDSKWWVNPLGKRKRSKDKPGVEWKEGMYYEN